MGSGAFLVAVCRFIAELLVKAWHAHKCVPTIPPDEDEILHARRIVAQRCLYGVDKNPMAVDLAKLSLWLATLARDHPFTFLDHALRCGDSLVGLRRDQLTAFNWDASSAKKFLRTQISERLRRVLDERRAIREARDDASDLLLRQKLAVAEEALNPLRLYGDAVVAAFFALPNDKARKAHLSELAESLTAYLANSHKLELRAPIEAARNSLPSLRPSAISPFHWEIEFPEVFDRENPGFDAFVGNPPFMGGSIVSSSLGMTYFDWLKTAHPPAGHLCDLVAYFFRRAFDLLRDGATLGFVATNTIAQGDTREGGLYEILKRGGIIFDATRRYRWPGAAAVVVSIVHLAKGMLVPAYLNGEKVERISSFLLARGGDESPSPLAERGEQWSLGTKIYGPGFLFEDGAEDSSPIESMQQILQAHPSYSDVIFPYIGGEELNSDPQHEHSRYVINLNDVREESGLDAWPELRQIVREKVKPFRDALGPNPNNVPLKKRWWAFQGHRPEFYRAARQLRRVLAQSQVSAHLALVFQPTDRIFANTLNLFLFEPYSTFAILQSRPHEVWARFFASSMKDDMRYTPSDCFETFPFPDNFGTNPILESAGQSYYDFRAALMVRNNEGLTKTYNRFHDPDERSPDILKLRELHAAMDRAVLDAYGWTDLKPTCEFLLDYEDEDGNGESGAGMTAIPDSRLPTPYSRRRKRPWRYRWPDDFRDEVLARLLELNRQRAEEERLSGIAGAENQAKAKSTKRAARSGRKKPSDQPEMF